MIILKYNLQWIVKHRGKFEFEEGLTFPSELFDQYAQINDLKDIIVSGTGNLDLKDKRFPNYLFISVLIIGIGYSAITNGLSNLYKPIGLFILFTVCGIVFHKIRLVAPGDMKFFSLFAFYLSWSINESIAFILFLLLYSILNLAIFIYKREHSIKAIFDSIRTQLIEFKIY